MEAAKRRLLPFQLGTSSIIHFYPPHKSTLLTHHTTARCQHPTLHVFPVALRPNSPHFCSTGDDTDFG